MRKIPIGARRTGQFAMTPPMYESSLDLIVRDHRRREFSTWKRIKKKEASLRIGVEDLPVGISWPHFYFPHATFVPIDDMGERERVLQSGAEGLDAILDRSEEAAAWTVLYPDFKLVVPRPAARISVGYAVAHGNVRLLASVNGWLTAERAKGVIDALYVYWMLREALEARISPRWSVIRDALGWVD